eukprot:Lankesteria_metandrocarpae@DN4302_c0_g1_i2.p1
MHTHTQTHAHAYSYIDVGMYAYINVGMYAYKNIFYACMCKTYIPHLTMIQVDVHIAPVCMERCTRRLCKDGDAVRRRIASEVCSAVLRGGCSAACWPQYRVSAA